MRELTAALMQAREGTGDVVEILMSSAFRPRLPGLTKMLSKLGKDGSWKKALELFEAAVHIGLCDPDTALTNAAVSACDKGGQWQKALEYFDKFEQMGIRRDAITYSATINSLGKGRQWEAALKVFDHMKSSGVQADVVTCCSLINALEKSGQWEMAETLFYYMKGDPLPENNEVVAEAGVVGGFGASSGGEWNHRQSSPNSMLRSVLRHNSLVSHLETVNEDNEIVPDDEFGSLGFILSTDDLVGTPVSAGSDQSSVSSGSSLSLNFHRDVGLGAWSNARANDRSRRDSISSTHSGGSQVPQNLLMEFASLGMADGPSISDLNGENTFRQGDAFVRSSSGQDAVRRSTSCFPEVNGQDGPMSPSELAKTIDFSHAQGVHPNRVCCNALMGAFARARPTQWKKAVDFVSYLWTQDESIQPDVITYNTALKACSSAFQLKQIEMLLRDMNIRGVPPNTATFQFIIEAATESHSSLFLKNVIQWLDDYPNLRDKCSSQLVVACMRCNMRDEAIEVFEDRLTANSHGVGEASEALFSGLIMQKDSDAVIRLLDVMCEMRTLPPMNVCSSLIEFLCQSNDWQPSANLLDNMISSDARLSDRMLSVSTVNAILCAMCRVIEEGASPAAPSPPIGRMQVPPTTPVNSKDQALLILPHAERIFGWFGDRLPCRPNQESFGHMVQMYSAAEDHTEVLMMNQVMIKHGCYPDEKTMSYILLASFDQGDIRNAIRLMSHLIVSGVTLSNQVISRGFDEALSGGDWHLAHAFCESLEKQNAPHESISLMYQSLLRKILQAGDNGTAFKLLHSLQQKPLLQLDPVIGQLIGSISGGDLDVNGPGQNGGSADGFGNVMDFNSLTIQERQTKGSVSQSLSGNSGGSSLFTPDYHESVSALANVHSPGKVSNRDLIDNLLDEWMRSGFLPSDVADDVRSLRSSHVCPTLTSLLDILRRVAEAGHGSSALEAARMCCSLHIRADALNFYQVPNMYNTGKHGWRPEINLHHICIDAGRPKASILHIIVASWVLAVQEAISWDLGAPPFDRFLIQIRADSAEELGKLSIGLIQLLTRGYSVVIPASGEVSSSGLPRFRDASLVTLFKQDETSGTIQVDVNGLACLS
jgi:pentatricopeptide repeat protein